MILSSNRLKRTLWNTERQKMTNKIKKRGNYTALSNEIINDSRLNLRSLGLFLYMWSKPDNWNFTLFSLAKARNVGRDQIRAGMQELIKYGYVEYQKQQDGTGIYVLDDNNRERSMKSPKVENPTLAKKEEIQKAKVGKPKVGKSNPLYINTIKSKKEINNHSTHVEDFLKFFAQLDPREIEQEKWSKINEMMLQKAIMTSKQREQWENWLQAQQNPVHDWEAEED